LPAVQTAGLGTFLLTSRTGSSCLPIDPSQTEVETAPEPQAPISEPSAFCRRTCHTDSSATGVHC